MVNEFIAGPVQIPADHHFHDRKDSSHKHCEIPNLGTVNFDRWICLIIQNMTN